MKIENSSISFDSSRLYSQSISSQSSVQTRSVSAKETNLDFYQNFLKTPLQQLQKPQQTQKSTAETIMSIKLQLIHKIFEAICGRSLYSNSGENNIDVNDSQSSILSNDGTISVGANLSLWERTFQISTSFSESECTTFESKGMVTTADGRNIDFNIELSMSRSFTAVYNSYESVSYMVTDPLMINIDSDISSVSDMKFFFDLDTDGEKEEISFAGAGCGFLALDKNGDGIINDGSELFGTKSGNGFADLAGYDSDKNNWIDENDQIYEKLRVWTKDEHGKDQLMDLKAAGVGAIYLGSAKTDFSLTDENNYVNAYIRSTGIFLKENGMVGTISQVDLTS